MVTADEARAEQLRRRYVADQVETASPEQRLLMLLGRVLADLRAADDGFERHHIEGVNDALVHGQQIVLVLRDSLVGSSWSGAEPLRAVYTFVHQRMVVANLVKDRSLLAQCTDIVGQIAAANAQAVASLAQTATPAPTTPPAMPPALGARTTPAARPPAAMGTEAGARVA